MEKTKKVALVAHDNRKGDLAEWLEWNYLTLVQHHLICTGTTGRLVEEVISRKMAEDGTTEPFEIQRLKSGPLGGDQQLGAMVAEGRVDLMIFFWDPMEPQPHDVDVKALLRIAVVYNIPIACNRSSADFMISSTLMAGSYSPIVKDYSDYLDRLKRSAQESIYRSI